MKEKETVKGLIFTVIFVIIAFVVLNWFVKSDFLKSSLENIFDSAVGISKQEEKQNIKLKKNALKLVKQLLNVKHRANLITLNFQKPR